MAWVNTGNPGFLDTLTVAGNPGFLDTLTVAGNPGFLDTLTVAGNPGFLNTLTVAGNPGFLNTLTHTQGKVVDLLVHRSATLGCLGHGDSCTLDTQGHDPFVGCARFENAIPVGAIPCLLGGSSAHRRTTGPRPVDDGDTRRMG